MRKMAMAASSSISCSALALLLGCTGHDTYRRRFGTGLFISAPQRIRTTDLYGSGGRR
jgi:hypothetical protein